MNNFKIYLKLGNQKILITSFNSKHKDELSPTSTFDEKISIDENDQKTLTFSLASKYIDIKGNFIQNPFVDRIHNHSIIELDEDGELTDFVISNISPSADNKIPIYTYTAKDYFSYILSRRCIGFSYCNIEDSDLSYTTYPELYDNYGAENIFAIGKKILKKAYLYDWDVYFSSSNQYHRRLAERKVSLDVEDSNPYNAIIEGCSAANCQLSVNYREKYITFFDKTDVKFSGYRYRPEYNLRSLSSLSYDSEELTTMLHVQGGKDENDQYITISQSFPFAVSRWLQLFYSSAEYTTEGGKTITIDGIGNWGTNNNITFNYAGWWKPIKTCIFSNKEVFLKFYQGEYNTSNLDEIKKYLDPEEEELNNFFLMTEKIPYVGQYILDLEFFKQNKDLTQDQIKLFERMINRITKNNILMKDIVYTRNQLRYQIEKIMAKINGQLDIRASILMGYIQSSSVQSNSQDLSTCEETIKSYARELGQYLSQLYGDLNGLDKYPEISVFNNQTGKPQYAREKLQDIKLELQTYKKIRPQQSDWTQTEIDAKIAALEKSEILWKALAGDFEFYYAGKDDRIKGNYNFIYSILTDSSIVIIQPSIKKGNSINKLFETYKSIENNLMQEFYYYFGNYIIESTYSNDDELDSVSLYNQAISYFEDIYKPKVNCGIDILDTRELELIDLPQIKIGNRIKIYNEELGLSDSSTNNLLQANNELVITSISYSLRESTNKSLGVEKVTLYNSILQKLIKTVKNK